MRDWTPWLRRNSQIVGFPARSAGVNSRWRYSVSALESIGRVGDHWHRAVVGDLHQRHPRVAAARIFSRCVGHAEVDVPNFLAVIRRDAGGWKITAAGAGKNIVPPADQGEVAV